LSEDEDIMNSQHIPSSIRRFDSVNSYQTMVSEITLPRGMHALSINPRAPQYQMALEQEEQYQDGEVTMRTNHTTAASTNPSVRQCAPPQGQSPAPPARKHSPKSPFRASNLPIQEEEEEEDPPLVATEFSSRKGTIGGASSMHPTSQLQGPFVSPGKIARQVVQMPSTPNQDSNPLLFPANLLTSVGDESISQESIAGPFVSPTAVDRRSLPMSAKTPNRDSNPLLYPANLLESDGDGSIAQESILGPFVSPSAVDLRSLPVLNAPNQNSNPLLYPRGLVYFPSSPLKATQASTKKSQPVPKASRKAPLPSLLLPVDTTSVESSSQEDAASASLQSAAPQQDDYYNNTMIRTESVASDNTVRVKVCPMEIFYIIERQSYVHTGFYSGPINARWQMHGNGVFWFTSGDLYLGRFCDGQLHGVGMMSVKLETNGVKQIFKGYFRYNEFVGQEEPVEDCVED
jgi:hypothetical protein